MAAEDYSGKIGLDTTDWKTGVSQINRDVRTLQSDFRVVAAGMDDWSKSADGLKARNETLTGVIDKQKQKVALMTTELERMKDEAEANGDTSQKTANAIQDFHNKVNRAAEELAKSETELRKNTAALDEMEKGEQEAGKETGKLTDEVKKSEKEHKAFGDTLKNVGAFVGGALVTSLKAAAAAAAAATAAIGGAAAAGFAMSKGAGEMADNVITLSDVTGVSTDTLQAWTYASELMDTSVDTMTKSMARMTREVGNAANGNENAQGKFDKLGVSIKDSSGNLRSAEDIFMDAIDALGGVANETERDAIAMELFGKSAQELNPLIKTGSEGLKALTDEAKAMGTVFSGDALEAMGSFDDSIQKFNATSDAMKNAIGLTLIPAFQPLVDAATTSMSSIALALQDGLQPGEFETIMTTILETVNNTLSGLTTQIQEAMPFITEGLTLLVASLVAYLPTLLETITPAAMGLLQGVMDAVSQNVDPIMSAATTLITSLGGFILDNIPLLMETAKSIIISLITYITENASEMLEGATQIITGIIDGITSLLPDLIPLAINMMVQLALALVDAIPKIVEKLPEIVSAIVEGLKNVDWIQLGLDMINGLYNGLSAAVTSLIESIKGVFASIWSAILGVFGIASPSTLAAEAGGFILDGLVNGFLSAVDAVVSKVKEIFGRIWDAIKSIFGFGKGESEESKEAKESGKNIMSGMQKGIDENKGAVETAVSNVSKDVLKKFRDELGVPHGSGESTKTKPYGESTVQGIAAGISAKGEESTFNGPAGRVKGAISSAFSSAFGVAGGWFGDGAASQFQSIGEAVAAGIAKGIEAGASRITSAAKTAANNALASAKRELGIQSPSKRAYGEIGVPFIQGITGALSDGTRALQEGVGTAMRGMTDIEVRPMHLPDLSQPGIIPVRAELVLDGRSFGALVVDIADQGQGFRSSNLQRLSTGVQLA